MTLTVDEKDELEHLRRSAALFMTSPLDRSFFELESLLENSIANRLDTVMPSNAFRINSKALIELKREFIEVKRALVDVKHEITSLKKEIEK